MTPHDKEQQLESLLMRYREACGPSEPSRNFMPTLWQKIEARQNKTLFFERIARSFVGGALAVCGCLGVLMIVPVQQQSVYSASSFVEDVANASAHETAPYLEPVRFDFNQDAGAADENY